MSCERCIGFRCIENPMVKVDISGIMEMLSDSL